MGWSWRFLSIYLNIYSTKINFIFIFLFLASLQPYLIGENDSEGKSPSRPASTSISSNSQSNYNEDDDEYDEEYDITTSTEGEVDGFIKFRPTVDELLRGEAEARSRSRSLPSSTIEDPTMGHIYSTSLSANSATSSGSDHSVLLSGRFLKQG